MEGLASWQPGKPRCLRSNEEWRQLLAEWDRSGLSAREFCRQRYVRLKSFYEARWRLYGTRSRIAPADPQPATVSPPATSPESPAATSAPPAEAESSSTFLPVKIVEASSALDARVPSLEVVLHCGRVLRVHGPFDRMVLVRLLDVLESQPC